MDVSDGDLEGYDVSIRTAPQPFVCSECERTFPAGVEQEYATGDSWTGNPFEATTCIDCHHIAEALVCGSRMHGALWAEIEAAMDSGMEITTACVAKVASVSAKKYLVERINKLNGL